MCIRDRYLLDAGALRLRPEAKPALYLSLLGAIDYEDDIVGIPVQKTVALTTFDQARGIVEQLREQGVDSVAVLYAVSYTHLQLRLGGVFEHLHPAGFRAGVVPVVLIADPVSYTHLDVYKRQLDTLPNFLFIIQFLFIYNNGRC